MQKYNHVVMLAKANQKQKPDGRKEKVGGEEKKCYNTAV